MSEPFQNRIERSQRGKIDISNTIVFETQTVKKIKVKCFIRLLTLIMKTI